MPKIGRCSISVMARLQSSGLLLLVDDSSEVSANRCVTTVVVSALSKGFTLSVAVVRSVTPTTTAARRVRCHARMSSPTANARPSSPPREKDKTRPTMDSVLTPSTSVRRGTARPAASAIAGTAAMSRYAAK